MFGVWLSWFLRSSLTHVFCCLFLGFFCLFCLFLLGSLDCFCPPPISNLFCFQFLFFRSQVPGLGLHHLGGPDLSEVGLRGRLGLLHGHRGQLAGEDHRGACGGPRCSQGVRSERIGRGSGVARWRIWSPKKMGSPPQSSLPKFRFGLQSLFWFGPFFDGK